MENFVFYAPTKIYFGKGVLSRAGEAAGETGAKRVFILYGSERLVDSGLLGQVEDSLRASGIEVASKGGVRPNPTLGFAQECAAAAGDFGAELMLGLGGGSALDTAKVVAAALANPETDVWDIWTGKVPLTRSMPIGAALTIPATGSECSDSGVITNQEIPLKKGLSSPWNRPWFALMDPSTGGTLPPFQLACSVTDIMMHTLDRYFNPIQTNQLTDEIAEGLLRVTVKSGETLLKAPQNYQALSELFWCGTISHNDLTGLGGMKDFAPHQLAHGLSALYDTAHGAALAAVWGAWASYVYVHDPKRFARYGKAVWGIRETDVTTAAKEAIRKTVSYFERLGLAVTIPGAAGKGELTAEDVAALTKNVLFNGARQGFGTFVPLVEKDISAIFTLAGKALVFPV